MEGVPGNDERKPHVVFIPFPVQGHIKYMLKLAKLLHHKGIHITFVNTESNHRSLVKNAGSHDLDGFQFKSVPDGLPSTSDDGVETAQNLEQITMYLAMNFFASFLDLVAGLETPPTCIISDPFMTFTNTLGAAEKLKIPIMIYWTFAASGFMGFYQAKVLSEKGLLPLKDESYLTNGYLDKEIGGMPGMERIRFRDLPEFLLTTKADDPAFHMLVGTARAVDNVSHIILHTFEELEAALVKEIKSIFPKIYTVGPLQLLLNQTTAKETNSSNFSLLKEEPECVQWLQSKEPKSVVYVNFGSLAVLALQDLLEFGWGLIDSNHYFLWIIRPDLVDGGFESLPPEFMEAIKSRGFIASWCSQEEVLNHPSVGGFLTHGGWGSVIEGLSAGLPMLCWPFSHDQKVNCRQMCVEWDFGMEITSVKRDAVEKLVRELMEGTEGRRMKEKAMELKKLAEIATGPEGSSSLNIEELVNEITNLSKNS